MGQLAVAHQWIQHIPRRAVETNDEDARFIFDRGIQRFTIMFKRVMPLLSLTESSTRAGLSLTVMRPYPLHGGPFGSPDQ